MIVCVTPGEGKFRLGEHKPNCQPWPHGQCVMNSLSKDWVARERLADIYGIGDIHLIVKLL